MIDSDAFIKRLQQLLDEHSLTAAAFADKIQVGRATISHILVGRNKPSLEFIMKIIRAFPSVDLYWLLEGQNRANTDLSYKKESIENTPTPPDILEQGNQSLDALKQEMISSNASKRTLKRIVLLFDDGSFENYL